MTKQFHPNDIKRVIDALKNDAAGNKSCTMTDLDSACDMLQSLLDIEEFRRDLKEFLKN